MEFKSSKNSAVTGKSEKSKFVVYDNVNLPILPNTKWQYVTNFTRLKTSHKLFTAFMKSCKGMT